MNRRSVMVIGGAVIVGIIVIAVLLAVLLPEDDVEPGIEQTEMLQMLDAMEQLMTGGGAYDREYYVELRECMSNYDPNLPASQDGAWKGMMDYWISDGVPGDRWTDDLNIRYIEHNTSYTEFLNMTIYEPCNYASNVAYYHDVTEICNRRSGGQSFTYPDEYINAFGKSFSTLAFGSAFMHASHTELGHQLDIRPISVIAYLIHQGSLSSFVNASCILTDLSMTPREQTALQLADEFVQMNLNMPVENWYNHTVSLDIPNYYLLFTGIFSTALTMVADDDFVNEYVPILCRFFGVDEKYINFTMQHYLPELRETIGDFDMNLMPKTTFVIDTVGAVVKLVYALMWQEEVLSDVSNDIFLNETVNQKGWEFLPTLNAKVNEMNSFTYTERDFQNGTDIYPGDVWCNPEGPHAKWHLESAIGLLDLVYVGDKMLENFLEFQANTQ